MKLKLLALSLLVAAKMYGQSKMVTSNQYGRNEVYYVSENDANIREGKYGRFTGGVNPIPIVEGFYHQNLKDGTWSFYSGGGALVAEGKYKEGKKVGVWTGYTRGFERVKYDFTDNQLLAYIPAGTDTVFLVKAANSTAAIERRPVYINGIPTIVAFLSRNIRYPAVARENRKQGEVIVNVLIDESGHAVDYNISKPFDNQIDEEVLRAFKLLDGEWLPGFVKGKPVATVVEVPVVFEINKPDNTPHKPNQIIIVRGA